MKPHVRMVGFAMSVGWLLSSAVQAQSPTFDDIKANFSICVGCHQSESGPSPRFDPLVYPFRDTHQLNVLLMTRIWNAVAPLHGDAIMPPSPLPPLQSDQLAEVRLWIEQGARTGADEATLTAEEIESILGLPNE